MVFGSETEKVRICTIANKIIMTPCFFFFDTASSFLVVDHNNSTDTQWWNSQTGQSSHVDFTNPDAAAWFSSRLETILRETGIDSFKFDAGETSWAPSVYTHNIYNTDYIECNVIRQHYSAILFFNRILV